MAKADIYETLTNQIAEILEQVDLKDYQAPFAALAEQGMPLNPTTDHYYQGINVLALWCDQQEKKYNSSHWATFKQWQEKGAQVRKGEKGSRIVFYKPLLRTEQNSKGDEQQVKIPMLRLFNVFNACQVDGYEHSTDNEKTEQDLVERIEKADMFCSNTKVDIKHGESEAYYHRKADYIHMPETAAFRDTDQATATENYYSVLFHELTHWTGAEKRLNRDKASSRQDREKYAYEELIAELGAAFLCASLGISQAPRESHALYIKSWLGALKNDKKFVFSAAAQAAKAVEYMNRLQDDKLKNNEVAQEVTYAPS